MSESEPGPAAQTCCPMRRKVVVGILAVLPEDRCGVGDAELADFLRFDLESPSGSPVLSFRFCPWCGKERGVDEETRIVDLKHDEDESSEGDAPGEGSEGS